MKKWSALIIAILFLYLLLFPETAVHDARAGLLLWYQSVVPVLFPFMLLCSLILRFRLTETLPAFLAQPAQILFGCSRSGAFAVITGFLCGFPMGAKVTSDLNRNGDISDEEAKFLYGFVNNLSPGFIVSFLACDQMKCSEYGVLFLINILGASVLYGTLTSVRFRKRNGRSRKGSAEAFLCKKSACEMSACEIASSQENLFAAIDDCIYDSVRNTLRLGGYIVFFSVLSGAALLLPAASQMPWFYLIANIEVTNGIRMICSSELSFSARFLLSHALSAFGGLSAAAQTAGISGMSPSLLFYYIKSRVMITLLSLMLSASTLFFCRFFL